MDSLHILVVDDNHINRLFFESALKKLSCSVETAINGFEAVDAAKLQNFDLILMDIRMDGMNGIESANHIKKLANHINTPIIAVSAETFALDNHPDFSASLLKPVNQEKLSQIIQQFTQKEDVFNHQKALEISHQDEAIVHHLRKLFISQLSEFKVQILHLYQNQQIDLLQEKLHQLLGSARICAAENVATQIEHLKISLRIGDESKQQEAIRQLMNAIKQILINFSQDRVE